MQNKINKLIKDFFEKLNISINSLEIDKSDDKNIYNIKIKTDESWLIIWSHWKNLDAIQNILKNIISNNIWEKIKIHLEINDYIKTKDDRLFDFIQKEIEYVKKTGKEIKLPYYSAYERKKIHSYVHNLENPWVETKSRWEWKERRLYITKEAIKLTIDVDWNDI